MGLAKMANGDGSLTKMTRGKITGLENGVRAFLLVLSLCVGARCICAASLSTPFSNFPGGNAVLTCQKYKHLV